MKKLLLFACLWAGTGIYAQEIYTTTNFVNGELYINHLNEVNQNNDTVKVREGRFDMHFEGWTGIN